jgi:flavorubredoxin
MKYKARKNIFGKEFNIKFFIDFERLLIKYIKPESEIIATELQNVVESVCSSHGYVWRNPNMKWAPDNRS